MLLLLGAISLAPFVGSALLYFLWKPHNFTNYGELLPVTPLADKAIGAEAFRFSELRGKWVFVMADSGACDEYCRSKLYIMRQVRLTQGKNQDRVERVWLVDDAVQPAQALEQEYHGTREVRVAGADLVALLPAAGSVRDHIYVVDPLGNLMMRFPRNADPSSVKKDISKLVKTSSGWVQTDK
jgi:hypothetical protein